MYSSSTSSSSQGSMGSSGGRGGLMRYGSAPGSFLATAVDSAIGGATTREFSAPETQNHLGAAALFFPSESIAMANQNGSVSRRNNHTSREDPSKANTTIGLQPPSYGFGGGGGGGASSSSLHRHSSSPAGFLNQLATAVAGDHNGMGSYNNSKGMTDDNGGRGVGVSRQLSTKLSFTTPQQSLSRISEETGNDQRKNNSRSYAGNGCSGNGFGTMGYLWEQTQPIMFSVAPTNGAKKTMETQLQFSMSQEMQSMDKLLNIPQDSVPCKIRAKRGFATHPRSIAERERRTRISGKLKKLQDLVPNMDKQTSYSDMLDLAVQHIKTLQNQVQKLHSELESCTCGCKKARVS